MALGRTSEQGGGELEPQKSYRTMMQQEIAQADEELQRPARGLLLSGIIAGLTIGWSLFFMATVYTLTIDTLSEPIVKLLVATAYTAGFIAVVLGRTDLFTEYTTIAILPVLAGRASVAALARLWALIYVGNQIGCVIFAAFAASFGPELGVIAPEAFGVIARSLTEHANRVLFFSGLLAGWLMGFVSWLVVASRDTISQVFFVWLISFAIGVTQLHHSVAVTVEILAGVFAGQGVTLGDWGRVLLWCTLGNAVGGGLFAVLIKSSLVAERSRGASRDV